MSVPELVSRGKDRIGLVSRAQDTGLEKLRERARNLGIEKLRERARGNGRIGPYL